jgi:hypothetical protein
MMRIEDWLKPNPVNPWYPFVTDRQAMEILEAEIERLSRMGEAH